jgi:hypothetical protein
MWYLYYIGGGLVVFALAVVEYFRAHRRNARLRDEHNSCGRPAGLTADERLPGGAYGSPRPARNA